MTAFEPGVDEPRLESWKDIAVYLQRTVRTVKRWELEEALPVHRHQHAARSSVYAYQREIDLWRAKRKPGGSARRAGATRRPWLTLVSAVILAALASGGGTRTLRGNSAQAPTLVCETCAGVGHVSRDGRRVVVSSIATGGDIELRDIATGATTLLHAKTDTLSPAQGGQQTYWPVLSNDAEMVAFLFVAGQDRHAQLRVMPSRSGGKARVLVDNPELPRVIPVGWRDTNAVLVLMQSPDQTWRLGWVSMTDGTITPIKSLQWRIGELARDVSLSPDGRYIAYSALVTNPPRPSGLALQSGDRAIYLLAADGSAEIRLTGGAGVNRFPVWMPDGSRVVYTSNASGAVDLWALPVSNGRREGREQLLRKDIGPVVSLGMSGQGTYHYFESRAGAHQTHIVSLGNGVASRPTTSTIFGMQPAWSPDGGSIAVLRPRPAVDGAYDIVVHALETGEERVHRHEGLGMPGPSWFPDGRSLLVSAGGWARLDLRADALEPLKVPRDDQDRRARFRTAAGSKALSPDGKFLVLGASARSGDPQVPARFDRVASIDVQTGTQRELFVLPGADNTFPMATQGIAMAFSPDGRSLAVATLGSQPDATRLARIDIDGQHYRELVPPFRNEQVTATVRWSRDGSWIYFVERGAAGKDRIMRVAAAGGGPPEFTGVEVAGLSDFDLDPSGRHVAFGTLRPDGSARMHWTLDLAQLLKSAGTR